MYSKRKLPPINLLDLAQAPPPHEDRSEEIARNSSLLEEKLLEFQVPAKVVNVIPGPVVKCYEIQLAAGTRSNTVVSLAKDLARCLSVKSVRIVENIPGTSAIGIEISNESLELPRIADILGSSRFQAASNLLSLGLGCDVSGSPVVVDLAKMPHLLVAGSIGSGKCVGIHTLLTSLLFKASPDQVRMLLIDPRRLELSLYNQLPHLISPVVYDHEDAAIKLKNCLFEIERRFTLLASFGVQNIYSYNTKIQALENDPSACSEALPFIVVVIDEFTDLTVFDYDLEESIARIAQRGRAVGVHLIIATQWITEVSISALIKANVPSRISFQVSCEDHSNIVLEHGGAESLLGYGDMLYRAPGKTTPERIHGAFVNDDEVSRIVGWWIGATSQKPAINLTSDLT